MFRFDGQNIGSKVEVINTLNTPSISRGEDGVYVIMPAMETKGAHIMGRPLIPNTTRKSLTLADDLWAELNEERKRSTGAVPTEMELIRNLIREALDTRYAARGPGRTDKRKGSK
jgi:hypothetical protein